MLEFLKSTYLVLKEAITAWIPAIAEIEAAAWGPFAGLKETVGTVATIIAVAIAIVKFLHKHNIDTW